jgi:hypothetical protein
MHGDMGSTPPGEWELSEEDVVQLWLVAYEGQVCGGPIGAMSEERFCIEEAQPGTSAWCGKAKGHEIKKHKHLKPGWYIGAGG